MIVMTSFMDDTELLEQEFSDNICWRLGLEPKTLPTNCDRCGAPFKADHTCCCKIVGLVTLCHNVLSDQWKDLCVKALKPLEVSNKPGINTGRLLKGEGDMRAIKESTKAAKL